MLQRGAVADVAAAPAPLGVSATVLGVSAQPSVIEEHLMMMPFICSFRNKNEYSTHIPLRVTYNADSMPQFGITNWDNYS
jgi:hypothetical protein